MPPIPSLTKAVGRTATAYLRRNFAASEELNRRVILSAVAGRRRGILLDLGCGDGSFTLRLGRCLASDHVAGVEIDEHLATTAEARGIDVHRGDIEAGLPFPDASVTVVHANQVIEHLRATDRFMAEIRRVLRPDGCAVISTNNLASLHNIFALVAGWQPPAAHVSDQHVGLGNPLDPFRGTPGAPGQMHLRLFTGRALSELAVVHGLRLERARTAGFYPLPSPAAELATAMLPRWGVYLVQRFRPA